MTFKKKLFVALAAGIAVIATAFFVGVFSLGKPADALAYSRALDAIRAYEGRNMAVTHYFENVRKDATTAKNIRDLAAEARKIGDSLRSDFALAEPFASSRKQFDRFIEIQCAISKTVDDRTIRASPAWTQVSQQTGRYNEAVKNNFTLYEKTFGTSKLLFRDCP
jgi:hypothetical protein